MGVKEAIERERVNNSKEVKFAFVGLLRDGVRLRLSYIIGIFLMQARRWPRDQSRRGKEQTMDPVSPIFQREAFDPDTIKVMVQAFNSCREAIPATMHEPDMEERMAKRIIELVRRGVRDPIELCADAKKQLGISN
jgi:hypothetical protein